jgi:CheY-like chemotaxis protein
MTPADDSVAPDDSVACILCVEPDPEARAVLKEVLSRYKTVFASDAYEAIRELNSRTCDSYVLECWLPDMSGVHLCREIRKTDPNGPVLFCTGAARHQDRARGLRAGANAYLCKPIDPPVLLNQLRVLLELAELESAHAKKELDRVVREELRKRAADILKRTGAERLSAGRAMERICKAKASDAFNRAGGTKAHLRRYWAAAFAGAWAAYTQRSDPCFSQASDLPVAASIATNEAPAAGEHSHKSHAA